MTDMTPLHPLAREILTSARAANLMVTAAESCTGGLVSAALTEIEGSSAVFERGFVTYSNEAKMDMLGVSREALESHGAVSAEVATEMALGALHHSRADVAVSITGIAGPGGGSAEKPVGLVHFAIACRRAEGPDFTEGHVRNFSDDGRSAIRVSAARAALEFMSNAIHSFGGMSTPEL